VKTPRPIGKWRLRLAVGALALFALAFAGCASAPTKTTATTGAEPPLAVIDAHIHTSFSGKLDATSKVLESRDGLAAEMKENNVVGAVAHTHAGGADYIPLPELHVIDCAGLGDHVDEAALDADLGSGKYRCIKIYLGYIHKYASDPAYEPAYRLAERHHVPVVFHTGDTDSAKAKLKYADPLTIDEVAVDHPNVTFVIAHAGNPWIESAAEVAYKNPNVLIDGSAFVIGDLASFPPDVVETYVVKPLRWILGYAGPEKLMFGTDWPLTKIGPYLAAFKRAIPRKHWKAVFHDNAARVFGFDQPKRNKEE
jgi:uncharacterized protein